MCRLFGGLGFALRLAHGDQGKSYGRAWVRCPAVCNIRHSALRAAAALSDLHLCEAAGLQVRNYLFPVHSWHFIGHPILMQRLFDNAFQYGVAMASKKSCVRHKNYVIIQPMDRQTSKSTAPAAPGILTRSKIMANEKTIDWANYVVDDAGYVIDTYTRLSSEAATLMAHASSTKEVEDIFGDVPTIAGERSEVARMLRSMASRLRELADTLDGPVVDERDSQKIGFDASHSVAVPIQVWEYTVEDDDGEVIVVFATAAEAHEFANRPENAQAGNHAAAVASRPKND